LFNGDTILAQKDSTEKKILESAKVIFAEKGFQASTMKDIASHAGVNKALLNYYFRSKEKLFNAVFTLIFEPAFKNFVLILDQDGDIFEILEKFIRSHQRFLGKSPEIPKIMARELTSKAINVPGLIYPLFQKIITYSEIPKKFITRINDAAEKNIIRRVDPIQLIVNILSMNIFIYVAEPILDKTLGQFIENKEEFMKIHEEEVVNMVLNSLRPRISGGEESEHV
jgi:AcrR family transcriptional regulator